MRDRTPALTAAAERIDPSDRKQAERARKRRQEWQTKAWNFYDEITEVRKAHQFVGRAMRELRLFVAYRPDPSQPPVYADPADPDVIEAGLSEQATFAAETLERLDASDDGLEGIQELLGQNVSCAGEGNLHQQLDGDSPTGEWWQVLSTDQVKADGGGFKIQTEDNTWRDLKENEESLVRIWQRHPRRSSWPDSNMRPLLDICDEVMILTMMIRGTSLSRAQGAGVWPIPDDLGPARKIDPDSGLEEDGWLEEMIEALTEPIEDPSSPSVAVPYVVKGPREAIEAMRDNGPIRFARETAQVEAEQRVELLGRLWRGLDLPPEVEDMNHWSAWLSDENVWKMRLRPTARVLVDGLSRGLLWPETRDAGFERPTELFVWFDPSGLISRPDEFPHFQQMHEAMVVSDAALRRVGGATDADAPDEAELARRTVAKRPAPVPASPSNVEPGPPEQEGTAAFVAASNGRDLGARLAELEASIRGRLQTAADVAIGRMLDRAGALVKGRLDPEARAAILDIPMRRVPSVVGRDAVIEHFAAAEDDLINDEGADLAELFVSLTQAGREEALRMAQAEAGIEISEALALAEQDRSVAATAAGATLLAGATAAIAKSLVFSMDAEPEIHGESQGLRVPPRQIRAAMRVAGGGQAEPADPIEQTRGGLTTGRDLSSMIEELGLIQRGFRWRYGASTNHFWPHHALDGDEFDGPSDPRLLNTNGWPAAQFFYPDDHPGCDCDTAPIYLNVDPAAPPAARRVPQ